MAEHEIDSEDVHDWKKKNVMKRKSLSEDRLDCKPIILYMYLIYQCILFILLNSTSVNRARYLKIL